MGQIAIPVSSKETETILWTNSSPTSSMGTATATLSDNMTNYKYLRILYRLQMNQSNLYQVTVLVSDFVKSKWSSSAGYYPFYALCTNRPTVHYVYVRGFYYSSSNKIMFNHSLAINNPDTDTSLNIPYQIIGIN